MEGNTVNIDMRDVYRLCVVKDPEHVWKLFERESGDPMFDLEEPRPALEIRKEQTDDERTWEVGRRGSS